MLFFLGEELALAAEETVEVLAVDDPDTLSRKGRLEIVVLVVEVIVGLEAKIAVAMKEIFDIEVADEGGRTVGAITVSEVTVDPQTVVEQSGGQRQIYLQIGEITLLRP